MANCFASLDRRPETEALDPSQATKWTQEPRRNFLPVLARRRCFKRLVKFRAFALEDPVSPRAKYPLHGMVGWKIERRSEEAKRKPTCRFPSRAAKSAVIAQESTQGTVIDGQGDASREVEGLSRPARQNRSGGCA
jgi:hypothetical protein